MAAREGRLLLKPVTFNEPVRIDQTRGSSVEFGLVTDRPCDREGVSWTLDFHRSLRIIWGPIPNALPAVGRISSYKISQK